MRETRSRRRTKKEGGDEFEASVSKQEDSVVVDFSEITERLNGENDKCDEPTQEN